MGFGARHGSVARWVVGATLLSACQPGAGTFPQQLELGGRKLTRYSVERVTIGTMAVYAPPGDHPTTAELTVGFLRSHLPVQQMVDQLNRANAQAVRHTYSFTPFETGDAVRFQNCRVYIDDIGQAAISWEVAERVTSESSVGTAVVRELDNAEEAGRGRRLCYARRSMLGAVWALHRTAFPAPN